MKRTAMLAILVLAAAGPATARDDDLGGVIAASRGESVVLVDPASAGEREIPTGPVGLIFPAPGGTLFAPDLVHGKTAVIDLVLGRPGDSLDGITMPWFGPFRDRYLVFGNETLLISYPDRALVARVPVEVSSPYQVEIVPGALSVLVLARRPDRPAEPSRLVAMDLASRKLVYDSPLTGNVVSMSLALPLGVLVLADRGGASVVMIDPGSRLTVAEFATEGWPVEALLLGDAKNLAVAEVRGSEGAGGAVLLWRIKRRKEELVIKKRREVILPEPPVRMAMDPTGRWLAVGLESGRIAVVDSDDAVVLRVSEGQGEIRDLRWCDLSVEGPTLPRWSDEEPPELKLDGFSKGK